MNAHTLCLPSASNRPCILMFLGYLIVHIFIRSAFASVNIWQDCEECEYTISSLKLYSVLGKTIVYSLAHVCCFWCLSPCQVLLTTRADAIFKHIFLNAWSDRSMALQVLLPLSPKKQQFTKHGRIYSDINEATLVCTKTDRAVQHTSCKAMSTYIASLLGACRVWYFVHRGSKNARRYGLYLFPVICPILSREDKGFDIRWMFARPKHEGTVPLAYESAYYTLVVMVTPATPRTVQWASILNTANGHFIAEYMWKTYRSYEVCNWI